jgi:hypothetical protein
MTYFKEVVASRVTSDDKDNPETVWSSRFHKGKLIGVAHDTV